MFQTTNQLGTQTMVMQITNMKQRQQRTDVANNKGNSPASLMYVDVFARWGWQVFLKIVMGSMCSSPDVGRNMFFLSLCWKQFDQINQLTNCISSLVCNVVVKRGSVQ